MNPIDQSIHHTLSSYEWLPLVFSTMTSELCPDNCSGQGYCENGQCVCLVQYSGAACQEKNIGYFIAFGSIFACLTVVVLVQLTLSLKMEFYKQKKRSWMKLLLKMNAHKLLYLVTFLATSIRCIYFFTKWHVSSSLSSKLWSAYFPLLLSGFMYLVCFWAEAYHLSDIKFSKPRFLSKSFIAFIVTNIVVYLVLALQVVSSVILDDKTLSTYILKACNAFFAFMMVLAVIFFLIYGVLVYFKVRGAFTQQSHYHVDFWTLHMSRLGLVAQAIMQFVTALFIVCDITKELWLDKLPILSQNCYDILFRIIEFGVVLWFPCVLWNYKSPETLWVLNPRKLFRHIDWHDQRTPLIREDSYPPTNYGSVYQQQGEVRYDCWICYDADRVDAGPLIQPCECRGDVATVHHECLRKWLMECANKEEALKCKVCNNHYKLKQKWGWVPRGFNLRHWLQTFCVLIIMVGAPFGAYAIAHSVITTYVRILVIGVAILIELICSRVLCRSLGICYKQSKLSMVLIEGREVAPPIQNAKSQSCDPCAGHMTDNSSINSTYSDDEIQNTFVAHQNEATNRSNSKSIDTSSESENEFENEAEKSENESPSASGINISSHHSQSFTPNSHHSRGFSFSVEAVIETTTNRSVH